MIRWGCRISSFCGAVVFAFSLMFSGGLAAGERAPKLLVLIIASENFPIYAELQKIWKSYMHFDPEHVEAYFIKGDPDLPTLFRVDGDVIWSKINEGYPGETSGIIDKTVYSMEAILGRLNEFDYVLRTNLSSFYVFPRLLERLKTLPRKGCYFASATDAANDVGSGCGFILSSDVVRLIVEHKQELIHRVFPPDDCIVARFLMKYGVHLIPHSRLDFITREDFISAQNMFPHDVFHFRIKTDPNLRLEDDIYIHKNLLRTFYGE